ARVRRQSQPPVRQLGRVGSRYPLAREVAGGSFHVGDAAGAYQAHHAGAYRERPGGTVGLHLYVHAVLLNGSRPTEKSAEPDRAGLLQGGRRVRRDGKTWLVGLGRRMRSRGGLVARAPGNDDAGKTERESRPAPRARTAFPRWPHAFPLPDLG